MSQKGLKKLEERIKEAMSYEEWRDLAQEYDDRTGMTQWKSEETSSLYDHAEIRRRLNTLRELRKAGDDEGLLFTLNEGIHGNMGGMGKSRLYNKAKVGTKDLIREYVDEIASALIYLADPTITHISLEEKYDFFTRASHCFGRSALMLSGGGQLGNFHVGVISCLAHLDLLPNVISGSSAGSIFAALAGTRTNEELNAFLGQEKFLKQIEEEAVVYENIVKKNKKVSIDQVESIINNLIPDLTFQEAFDKTGREINISVAPFEAHQKSRLLNAIASPNVMIRSAVMASCAVPGIYPPVMLMAKNKDGKKQAYLPSRKWVDGSMSNDLPSKRLTRLFGVNHFIVSLTNPVVLPFISNPDTQNEIIAPIRKLAKVLLKETTQFNYSIAKRFFKFMPPSITFAANAINSLVQQDYTGDINIIADFNSVRPDRLLSSMSKDKLMELIKKGERATWPKVEAIRITTKIGRILDEIMVQLTSAQIEAHQPVEVKKPKSVRKKRVPKPVMG